jgi:RNA polymerase sigma factor, sigma-70 family
MNPERFKAEVLPLREKLFRIACKMLEDELDAEDAVQEAYLRLWHTRDVLDKYDSISAFATTVTKNICIDKLRIRHREEPMADNVEQTAHDNPYLMLEKSDTEKLISSIIDQLPPLQRMIMQMKDVEEMENEEIASITGTNIEAVRMNLSRARKRVREIYLKLTAI